MLNKIRDDIVSENIRDIHNNCILKNIRNYLKNHNNKIDKGYYYDIGENKININIEWKDKSLDVMSFLWIFLLVFSTLCRISFKYQNLWFKYCIISIWDISIKIRWFTR